MKRLTDYKHIQECVDVLNKYNVPKPHFIKFKANNGMELELDMEKEYPQGVIDLIPSDMLGV